MTTTQVAEQLGMHRNSLTKMLSLHPELRPAKSLVPSGALLWTQEEVQRVVRFREKPNKGGRPRKQQNDDKAGDILKGAWESKQKPGDVVAG